MRGTTALVCRAGRAIAWHHPARARIRPAELHDQAAGRRRRLYHALELPGSGGHRQDGRRDRDRLHDDRQTVGRNAADCASPGSACRPRRYSGRRPEHTAVQGPGGYRTRALQQRRCAHVVLHGQHRHRQKAICRFGWHGQTPGSRTRRQCPVHRVRRRRPRQRPGRRARCAFLQQRPDLRRRQSLLRTAGHLRRIRKTLRRQGSLHQRR